MNVQVKHFSESSKMQFSCLTKTTKYKSDEENPFSASTKTTVYAHGQILRKITIQT